MEIPMLKSMVVVCGLAVLVLFICQRLRLPIIVGLLFTGIAAGPHGLALITETAEIDALAAVGIMLLLFTIGLEFSIKRLLEIKRYFFIGGAMQVGLTILAGFCISKLFGKTFGDSLFLGFLLSMSSTAIVLKALEAQNATDSPQGRVSVGILIFQDIIAIPMMILTPVLGNAEQALDMAFIVHLLLGMGVICIVFLIALKIVPTLLYYIARMRSRELFLLSVLTICFAVAWLASSMGLSLAIGAFMAGLIIAESEYRHEVVGSILPLQDIFASLFFVSIGMLVDLQFVFERPATILLISMGIILIKGLIVGLTALSLGMPIRVMILAGLALSQIGEFSFVLAENGLEYGIGDEFYYQLFLAVSLITMGVTPSLIACANQIAALALYLPLPAKWKSGLAASASPMKHGMQDHVIIIGFGIAGRNLARASKEAGLSYVILEMNPETVRIEKKKGEPIHFGDASHESILEHIHVGTAKAIAIMINDPHAAKRIVVAARKLNPEAYLIVRTRYIQEASLMYQLGATDVIPDEVGTSVEMFTRVLKHYQVSPEHIETFITTLRQEGFQLSRP